MNDEDVTFSKLKPNYKLWLEFDGKYVFGPGAYAIMNHVLKKGTLTGVTESTGMSYRYAWGVIRKIEATLGVKILVTFKGGPSGGGGAKVTDFGLKLMQMFAKVQGGFDRASEV
ncbi:MAG: molybdenum-binding protein [Candidatus Thorarchaeota archaeon]|nr:molybdenum-binding protein [Candidatus Thorarchaeota archaeon]